MAGRGPLPKETRSRDRDTPTVVEIPDEGKVYGWPLPDGVLPNGESWHPQTVALWEAFRVWPVMADLPEVSWLNLVDTMLQHHVMWTKGRWEFASEVRLRLAAYFVTPAEQARAKIKVQTPAAPVVQSGTADDLAARRARLTG